MLNCEKSGYVELADGRLWYEVFGAHQDGVPLIVVNGGPGCSMSYLLEPIASLSDERPVVFYDQRDTGKSDRFGNKNLWTLDKFVEDLRSVISYLKFDKIHLLGQSWGTMLITEYILVNTPDDIISLVFSGACFSVPLWAEDQRKLLKKLPSDIRCTIEECEIRQDYRCKDYLDAVNYFYREHVYRKEGWPECLNDINLELYEYMSGPSEFTNIGTLKEVTWIDRLSEIKIPTLLTCGEFDESTPETNKYYQQLIAGSQLEILPKTSHEHHLEDPKMYLEIVRGFLNRVEGIGADICTEKTNA